MAKTKRRKTRIKKAPFIIIFIMLAVAIIFHSCDFDSIFEKAKELSPSSFTYPVKYQKYVIKYSTEYDIDPRFVYAVINTESHFNPKATSDVGARGLMQLMEDAYDWVKYSLNDTRNHTYDDMYKPELNIQYGTYMLKYLYDKYGSYELTAAAYHGGMGSVDSWISEGTINPDNFKLSDVPSDVTANYIHKVMKAYNKYKEKSKEEIYNG
ncbi:MAG: lytic transglycosylase domain-containing protein [Ruminococcus sp.]|nr:lytic transglycosylase domain-containing protein [Ruminococcus sp.]